MKSVSIIFILCCILLIATCNRNTKRPEKKIQDSIHNRLINNNNFSGIWQRECQGEAGHINILKNIDTAIIEVNSNQIIVLASVEVKRGGNSVSLLFRLIDPYELGPGGMNLEWSAYSRDSTIAKMKLIDNSSAKIVWLGFYNTDKNKREWVDGFDLLDDNRSKHIAYIKRCDLKKDK